MKLSISEADIKNVTGLNGYGLFSHQRRKKKIIKLVSKKCKTPDNILDVGCASGDISVELSFLGYKVHGIDLEPRRVRRARELANKYGQRIEIELKPFEDLHGRKAYDLVLLGEILEHFPDPVRILNDIKKILNPSGRVLVTTPNMPSLRNRLTFGLFGVFPDNNPEHKYYFDHRRFKTVVSNARYDLLYFKTSFTNIIHKTKLFSHFESIILSWFTILFPKSGDTIFAIISPKDPIKLQP